MHWSYYDHALFCVDCEEKVFSRCYQLFNKAIMYRSVNILLLSYYFVCDLLDSCTVDFIAQNNFTLTCTLRNEHVISQT